MVTETKITEREKNEAEKDLKEPLEGGELAATDAKEGEKPAEIIHDHPIFRIVEDGDLETIQNLIEVEGLNIELEDQHGMTPLMHSCWKGTLAVTEYLLKQGADPNGGNHEHHYTCLHFAGLAGKAEVCRMLLEAGAKSYHTNTVNRTAASMAAFVGNHDCVSIINNFVAKEDVWYYTRKQPLESEPKLPVSLAKPLYRIVMGMNTHPVRIALLLREEPALLQNISKVTKVLELMSDKEYKNRRDVNEVLSLKFHILQFIFKNIELEKEKDEKKSGEKKTPFIDRWIKSMLIGRESDGYAVYQENFLRQGIKEFPYPELQLFKMLVTNFSHCMNYGDGQTAAEYINGAFNGQKGFKDFENCDTCGEEKAMKKCATCKSVDYCNQTCQKFHWFMHKKFCANLATTYKESKERQDKREKEEAEKKSNEENAKGSDSIEVSTEPASS